MQEFVIGQEFLASCVIFSSEGAHLQISTNGHHVLGNTAWSAELQQRDLSFGLSQPTIHSNQAENRAKK